MIFPWEDNNTLHNQRTWHYFPLPQSRRICLSRCALSWHQLVGGKGGGQGTLPGTMVGQTCEGLRIWSLACIPRSRQSSIQGEPGRGRISVSVETSIHLLGPPATPTRNHGLPLWENVSRGPGLGFVSTVQGLVVQG